MKPFLLNTLACALLLGTGLPAGAAAADGSGLAATCRAESTYDLSIGPDWLHFQREQPQPSDVRMGGGRIQLHGSTAEVNLEDRDRLVLFEQVLRGLVPDVKALARQGVDLALDAVRAEMREMTGAPPNAQAEARLRAHRDRMHARIDASLSTRDWQGAAFEAEMQAIVTELVPLLGADVARRAMELAMAGDMAAAGVLQRRAQNLPTALRARIEASLEPLQPGVARLCPRIRELAELNAGMSLRSDDGARLELLTIRD